MHAVEKILEAANAAVATTTGSTVQVFTHRGGSLFEERDELPAISLDYGEDSPDAESGVTLDGVITSILTINVAAVTVAVDEINARRQLLDMRSLIHQALRRNPDLGLPFVRDVVYGGANAPEIIDDGDKTVGELVSIWGVIYDMQLETPEIQSWQT